MKNDTTTTILNFVLSVLVILGVAFTVWNTFQVRSLRQITPELQFRAQNAQRFNSMAQMLANDALAYNEKVRNPDLARILQAATQPAAPAK